MDSVTLWTTIVDGAFIMIPLAVMLIVVIIVFIVKCVVLKRASKLDPSFMNRIRDHVLEGDLESAAQLCRHQSSPYSRLILKGVTRIGRPLADIRLAIENAGNMEAASLSKGLPWLYTIAASAPLLGLLGTVIGMVDAFHTMAQNGSATYIGQLSSGIYQALVTTIVGLGVGILALFAYNILVSSLNRIITLMEARTEEFIDFLNEPS